MGYLNGVNSLGFSDKVGVGIGGGSNSLFEIVM